jgi:hypothetical protein
MLKSKMLILIGVLSLSVDASAWISCGDRQDAADAACRAANGGGGASGCRRFRNVAHCYGLPTEGGSEFVNIPLPVREAQEFGTYSLSTSGQLLFHSATAQPIEDDKISEVLEKIRQEDEDQTQIQAKD